MRRWIGISTILIVLLSLAASLAGVLSYRQDRYRTVVTPRGETVEIRDTGVYRHSVRALVTGGTPWDFVRLLVGIPVLVVSFALYLRGSVRGLVLFVGSLGSFLYQYLLWTFDWAYNAFFLVYVAIFSLSLWTLVFVLRGIDQARVLAAVGERFPVVTTATFSFAVGTMLLLKCLGETLPGLPSGVLPDAMAGCYTMVDQALDPGLLTPFCAVVGVLLLKRDALGYLLAGMSLVLFLSVGLSVVAGEVMLALSAGHVNARGNRRVRGFPDRRARAAGLGAGEREENDEHRAVRQKGHSRANCSAGPANNVPDEAGASVGASRVISGCSTDINRREAARHRRGGDEALRVLDRPQRAHGSEVWLLPCIKGPRLLAVLPLYAVG